MSIAIGETIGPYRIIEPIGQGGMATVFKAYHANLDRYVAFKVLHPAFKEDPNFLERFKREAQIVAKLEHPAIVPVYDYSDVNGQPFLVMKFIEGETLKARLKRGPIPLLEIVRILETVAQALTYAHERGILHRDIKPSNILLDKYGIPYITDFGLARIAQAGESTLSQDMMLGTPQYISPEQAQGMRDLGPATDIYSLGVLLYELVVGRVPFNADTPYAIVHDHIYKPLPMPTQINPEVPPEVERVLLRALAKNPQDRHSSAIEMIAAFKQAVTAADMTDISHVQSVETPVISSSAVTLPPQVVSPPPMPAYPVIPSPVGFVTDSKASKLAYRKRRNLWILGGIGALLLNCLIGMYIFVSAISDPELRPWSASSGANEDRMRENFNPIDVPPDGTPGMVTVQATDSNQPFNLFAIPGGMDLSSMASNAQTFLQDNLNNPRAYLAVALTRRAAGDREAAVASVTYAIDGLNATPEMVAEFAKRSSDNGYQDLATWMYMEVLAYDDLVPEIRNEAGWFLYQQAENEPAVTITVATQFLERRAESAGVYAIRATAYLQARRANAREQAAPDIEAALNLNPNLAEAYLVRGIYYLRQNDTEAGNNDLQQATSFEDAPEWVVNQAESRLSN
jgi:tRNA A-37 threonylcarbamoyl transferase component Bud32/Tfp pilus assembly protein PilF